MQTAVMTITPSVAKKWLEANTSNRPVRNGHVSFLAKQMREGRWQVNGETIKFNGAETNPHLLDGQHRLMAVVESETTIQSLVSFGISASAFSTIDTGVTRKASDVLFLQSEVDTNILAAALRHLYHYRNGTLAQMGKTSIKASNDDIVSVFRSNPSIRQSLDIMLSSTINRFMPVSMAAFCHYIFGEFDRPLSDTFFQKLDTGIGLSDDDAVYLLRERLLANKTAKAKIRPKEIMALTIKAWNFARVNASVKSLRWRTAGPRAEAFPIPE